ncbi:MAG: hypothetical protein ACHP7N_07035 [Caulobacterales bacterium]
MSIFENVGASRIGAAIRRAALPLSFGALVAALAFPAAAGAGELQKPSAGYVYFHRAGADMAAHDAAVGDCVRLAGSLDTPNAGGLVGAVMIVRFNDFLYRANIENCLMAKGWDVVRVSDEEGKAISALPAADQSATLSPWVGAAQAHGDVVRAFEPLAPLMRQVRNDIGQFPAAPPLPLSVTAGGFKLQRTTPHGGFHEIDAHGADTQVKPGDSVIVIRMWSHDGTQPRGFWFGRTDDPGGLAAGPHPDDFPVAAHGKQYLTRKGPVEAATYVIPVKPGRWRLLAVWQDTSLQLGATGISLCIGGPVFDVGPGEAVYAGSFDMAADDFLAPDMSLATVTPTLRDEALAARLGPAHWMNAAASPCAGTGALYLYAYAMPGAPAAATTP